MAANRAAGIRRALTVSVSDAHLGEALAALGEPTSVVTSDTDEVQRIAAHLGAHPTTVHL